MRASHSRIGSYAFCPKKYEFRYVLDAPAPAKPELAFGVALHAALEENFQQKLVTRRDLPTDDVRAVFLRELDGRLAAVPEEMLRGPSDLHYLRSMGEQMLSDFLRERAPSIQPAPRGVETPFRLPLPGGHEISGRIDLLDDDWVLHDFKTSSKPYDPRKADRAQLVLYAWACERLFGRPPKELRFDVFVKGDGAEGYVGLQEPVRFPVPGAAEMAQVARRLQAQIDQILRAEAEEIFPRAFVPLRCGWCEYQEPCLAEWRELGEPAPMRLTLNARLG